MLYMEARWKRLKERMRYLFRCVLRLTIVSFLCEDYVEYSMGAAAGLIHVGGRHSPENKQHGKQTLGSGEIICSISVPNLNTFSCQKVRIYSSF